MIVLEEGDEFYVEDHERWTEFQPKIGTVIEVDGTSTDHSYPPGLWLAFVIMGVQLDADSSLILEVKFVGSEEADVNNGAFPQLQSKEGFPTSMYGKALLFRCRGFYARDQVPLLFGRRIQTGLPHSGNDQADAEVGWCKRRCPSHWRRSEGFTPQAGSKSLCSISFDKSKRFRSPGRCRRRSHASWTTGRSFDGTSASTQRGEASKGQHPNSSRRFWGCGGSRILLGRKYRLCVASIGDRDRDCRDEGEAEGSQDGEAYHEEESEEGCLQDPALGPWGPSRRSRRRSEPIGYKRWFVERDSVTAGPQGRRSGERKVPKTRAVEEEFGKLNREKAHQVALREEGQERERIIQGQEEEAEEKEEDEDQTGPRWEWSDRQLREQLQHVFKERCGLAVRERAGAPFEKEGEATSGVGVEDVAEPRKGTVGSELEGSTRPEHELGRLDGSEDGELLRHLCEAYPLAEHGCTEGPSSAECGHRSSSSRRSYPPWRLSSFKVRGDTSGRCRWRMAGGKAFGALSYGGGRSYKQRRPPRDQEARETSCKGSRPGCLPMERIRKRKRREERQEREVGRPGTLGEGIRKERQGWQRTQGRLESRRSQQVEGEQRDPRQEVGAIEDTELGRFEAGHFARALVGAQVDLAGLVFDKVILQCRSFKCTGCVLAWMIIRGRTLPAAVFEELGFPKGILELVAAKTKGIAPRKKGASFPLREGELSALVSAMSSFTLMAATAPENVEEWATDAWRFLVFGSLNFLHSGSAGLAPGRWSASDRTVAATVGDAAFRRMAHDHEGVMTLSEWEKDVGGKLVGYGGEEISRCFELSLDQVLPSLPLQEHGGSIEAIDWVGHRTRRFLLDPKLVLKEPSEVTLPRMPGKIHMKASDRVAIGNELIARNICEWIDVDQVYRVGGVPVLNGLFGVEKASKLADGRAVLRLIMNLTGSNSTQDQLEGTTFSLPSITSWQSIFLEGDQTLALHQSDMSSAFYLFRLPRVWLPYLAFAVVVPGSDIDRDPRKKFALACKVLPMGWLSSVGIMQEISENILKRRSISRAGQVAKMKPLPHWFNEVLEEARFEDKSWWHVYLDNFACGERITPADSASCAAECHRVAEEAWAHAGIVSSSKKKVSGASRITELGAEIDGLQRALGASSERLLKVIQTTLWWMRQKSFNRKHLQIIAGRWVFILQFRRPAMVTLDWVWKAISGQQKLTTKLKNEVHRELFTLICLGPLLHCHFGGEHTEHHDSLRCIRKSWGGWIYHGIDRSWAGLPCLCSPQ